MPNAKWTWRRVLGCVFLLSFLLVPSWASHIDSSRAQESLEQLIGGSGRIELLEMQGVATQSTAPTGRGRLYFDSDDNKWKVSESAGAYTNLVGSGVTSMNGLTGALSIAAGSDALTVIAAGSMVTIDAAYSMVETLPQVKIVKDVGAKTYTFTSPHKKIFGGVFNGAGSPLVTGNMKAALEIPHACTINGWYITLDLADTATFKVWKRATGTAIPTVADSINTAGVSISAGTLLRSTTVTDFTTTAVALNDVYIMQLSAVGGVATEAVFGVECSL